MDADGRRSRPAPLPQSSTADLARQRQTYSAVEAALAAVGLSDTSGSQAMREIGGRAGYKVIALSPSSTRASG